MRRHRLAPAPARARPWPGLALWFALFGVLAGPSRAVALELELELPIDCRVGRDCHVQNYVDLAPGPDWADPHCGPLTYDKHKGTDFRIDYARMRQGVAARAAAAGTVAGLRDGMPDISVKLGGAEAVKNRECGNGVTLRHADGVETQYCHLRKGSIRVKLGETVAAGQELGLVGLSGQTVFAHLHFEVRVGGLPTDPFSGTVLEGGCAARGRPLWSEDARKVLPYLAAGPLDAGFAAAQPDLDTLFVSDVKPAPVDLPSPKLLYWAAFWGARRGDVVRIEITTPSGERWSAPPHLVQRDQAQLLVSLGRRRVGPAWPAGTYRAEAVLTRQVSPGQTLVIALDRALTLPLTAP